MILLHVVVAICSLSLASLAAYSPKRPLLRINYAASALTFVSGAYLVYGGAPVLQTCLSGVAYLAVVGGLLAVARLRLARLEAARR